MTAQVSPPPWAATYFKVYAPTVKAVSVRSFILYKMALNLMRMRSQAKMQVFRSIENVDVRDEYFYFFGKWMQSMRAVKKPGINWSLESNIE